MFRFCFLTNLFYVDQLKAITFTLIQHAFAYTTSATQYQSLCIVYNQLKPKDPVTSEQSLALIIQDLVFKTPNFLFKLLFYRSANCLCIYQIQCCLTDCLENAILNITASPLSLSVTAGFSLHPSVIQNNHKNFWLQTWPDVYLWNWLFDRLISTTYTCLPDEEAILSSLLVRLENGGNRQNKSNFSSLRSSLMPVLQIRKMLMFSC